MARGFLSALEQMARAAERDARRRQRDAERQRAQQYRNAVRAAKARERARNQAIRAAELESKAVTAAVKAAHIEAREAEVEALNAELEETYAAIDGLLIATLDVDDYFDLEDLRRKPEHPPFADSHLERPTVKPTLTQPPLKPTYHEPPPPKVFFGRKKKHEAAIADAQAAHVRALAEWRLRGQEAVANNKELEKQYIAAEKKRQSDLEKAKVRYSHECATRDAECAEYNASVDSLIANLAYGATDAVEAYMSIVFSHSIYPESFPVSHESTFEPSAAELHVRVAIPTPTEIPSVKAYRYVKKNDDIVSSELSQKARKDRYSSAVHQVAIRSIHEVFEADRRALIKTVSLRVGTNTTDPATGKLQFIPFAVVAAERDSFLEFDLSGVVPKSTLEHLGGALSKDPYGLTPADTSGVRRT